MQMEVDVGGLCIVHVPTGIGPLKADPKTRENQMFVEGGFPIGNGDA